MNDNSSGFLFGILVGFGLTVGIMGLSGTTPKQIHERWRNEAVDLGYGEWVLMNKPGPDAEFEFKWLEKQ